MPGEAVQGLIEMFDKMIKTPEWIDFANKSGLLTDGRTGEEFKEFLDNFNQTHIEIMEAQGWIK